jgi:hypothetical protein
LGYENPVSSDHQPFKMTIKINNNNTDDSHQNNKQRTLISKNMQLVIKYINAKYQMMKARNIFKIIEKIQESNSIKEELDQINRTITDINLKAEKKIRKFNDKGWSTTIPKLKQKSMQLNRRIGNLLKNKQGQ